MIEKYDVLSKYTKPEFAARCHVFDDHVVLDGKRYQRVRVGTRKLRLNLKSTLKNGTAA